MISPPFSRRDLRSLQRQGVTPAEARRQGGWIRRPPRPFRLLRPCGVGDGIERLTAAEARRLPRLARAAAASGQFSVFLPASGAASRLFQTLLSLQRRAREFHRPAAEVVRRGSPWREARHFFRCLPWLALARPLERELRTRRRSLRGLLKRRDYDEILDALFSPRRLGLADLPKGLVPFHGSRGGARTAFEEHLREAASLTADDHALCRIHVTVAPEHRRLFAGIARRVRIHRAGGRRVRFSLRWSLQHPRTHTLTLDFRGRWGRRKDGSLLFRPGGHGALLSNLERSPTEFVFIRNIDNVPIEACGRRGRLWRWRLAGKLLEVRGEAREWLHGLAKGPVDSVSLAKSERFVRGRLGLEPPEGTARRRLAWVRGVLDRPWRVCAMIKNAGQPGGGPFWVREGARKSKQIVESAQAEAGGAAKIWKRSTHFNPVDMVVALRDARGRVYRLSDFADPRAVIVSRKAHVGGAIRVLERPGLWNGGMSRWNTIFVEVPGALFHPVKTITDLLRPGHRGPR